MKKYKHRHLKTINKAITVAYLITAIAWGVCACNFNENRNELKQQYIAEEITKEEFLKLSHEKTLKEEKIFNGLAIGFCSTFAIDIAFNIATMGKEY